MSLEALPDTVLQSVLPVSYNSTFESVSDAISSTPEAQNDSFDFSLQTLYPLLQDTEDSTQITERKNLTSIVTHAEFLLWRLNEVDISLHPFLSHWVDTVARLQGRLASASVHTGADKEAHFAWAMAMKTRLEVIRALLEGQGDSLHSETPQSLLERAMKGKPVKLEQATEWLYETGVWDRPPPTTTMPFTDEPSSSSSSTATTLSYAAVALRNGTASINTSTPSLPAAAAAAAAPTPLSTLRAALAADAPATLDHLAHLPLALPSLETITQLLASGAARAHGVDEPRFARDYVQRCLRQLEGATAALAAAGVDEGGEERGAGRDPVDRAEVARLVALLVLFMRSLMDKGVVDFHALEWEWREVFVRYVWVPEVRDIRAVFGFDEAGASGWWTAGVGGGIGEGDVGG